MVINSRERTSKGRRCSYDARTLRTCAFISSNGKKRIHVPSLKRQLLRMSKYRDDALGPQWKYWTDRSLKKLEDNGILESHENSSVKLTPKAQKIISAIAESHHLAANDPRMFEGDDDGIWQYAARKATNDGKSRRKRAISPADLSALGGKPLEKLTKAELLALARHLTDEVFDLKQSYETIADSSLDYMDELENQKLELYEKSSALKAMQEKLEESQDREQTCSPQRSGPVFARPVTPTAQHRPNATALRRLASGSFFNTISGQHTPEPSEVDPSSPRMGEDLLDFDAPVGDVDNMFEENQDADATLVQFGSGDDVEDLSDEDEDEEDEGSARVLGVRAGPKEINILQKAKYLQAQRTQEHVLTPLPTPPRGVSKSLSRSEENVGDDLRLMANKITELEGMLGVERAGRETEEETVKQLQAQLAERDASNKSLTTTLTTLQATHADLLQQHSSTIALVHTLQTQLTASLTKVQTLETAHNTTTSALHRSERALADSQELCSGWEQKAQILLDRVERNRDIARKKIERLGKEVRERGKERDAAVMRASMLQGGLTAAEAERDALRMRVAAVEEECVSIGRSVSDVSRERDEGQREVVSLRAQLETRQTEQLTLVTRIAGLEANLAAETTTKLSLESQLLALKTSSEQMTKEITSKSAELHTALKRHREDSARIYQRHHRVLANLRQDLSSRTQLLEQRDADVATLNGSLATAHEEVRLLTLRLEVSAGLLESTKVMLDEAEARADALDEEAEELREAVASEREAVKRAREALVEMMRKRREEEEREMEKVMSSLTVVSPLPARKRRRTEEEVRDSGVGL